jgi:hypothetical protein
MSIKKLMRDFIERKLDIEFYLQPTLKIARELLGKVIVRKLGDKILAGKLLRQRRILEKMTPQAMLSEGKRKGIK